MHSIPPPFATIQSFLDSCATIPFTTKQAFPSNLFIHSLYNYSFIPFVTIQSLSSQLCNHSLYNDSNIPFTTIQIFPFFHNDSNFLVTSIQVFKTSIQTFPSQLFKLTLYNCVQGFPSILVCLQLLSRKTACEIYTF